MNRLISRNYGSPIKRLNLYDLIELDRLERRDKTIQSKTNFLFGIQDKFKISKDANKIFGISTRKIVADRSLDFLIMENIQTHKIKKYPTVHKKKIKIICVFESANLIISGGEDKKIVFYSIDRQRVVKVIFPNIGHIMSVIYNEDLLLFGGTNSIFLFRLKNYLTNSCGHFNNKFLKTMIKIKPSIYKIDFINVCNANVKKKKNSREFNLILSSGNKKKFLVFDFSDLYTTFSI